jgi:hypothetical protein
MRKTAHELPKSKLLLTKDNYQDSFTEEELHKHWAEFVESIVDQKKVKKFCFEFKY